MGTEEILLRNHVPYKLLVSRADAPAAIPDGCDIVLVAAQKCLSDKEIATLEAWLGKGGKLVVTGCSGDSDELNRQRWCSPFASFPKGGGLVCRAEPDICAIACGSWEYRVAAPKDGGSRLVADLADVGFSPEVSVGSLPERVFVEMKKTAAGYAVHLLDYDPSAPVSGAALHVPKGAKAVFRDLNGGRVELRERGGMVELPGFTEYSLVEVFLGKDG